MNVLPEPRRRVSNRETAAGCAALFVFAVAVVLALGVLVRLFAWAVG